MLWESLNLFSGKVKRRIYLKSTIFPLAMMFVASIIPSLFFSGIGYLSSHSLRIYLVRLVLQQELGSFRRWLFV